jgi:hypothetical protein
MFKFRSLALSLSLFPILSIPAQAVPTFPYSARVRDYNGWNSAVRGDTNTVGMAGATVALPNSISSAEGNPAGYAMELSALSVQLNKNTIHDTNIQKSGDQYDSSQWGLAVSPPPWGFGVSYYSPASQSGRYQSPVTGDVVNTEVSVKELRLTAARAFFNSRLSIGFSLQLMKAVREIGGYDDNHTATGMQLGVLYRLKDHIILGASFEPQTTIDPAGYSATQAELPGFNHAIISPSILAFGFGWIPNRFFRAGASLYLVAPTDNTAILYDQTQSEGQRFSLQPRLGASYVVAEYSNFKIEWAAGTYYENSRIDREPSRMHFTTGLEVNPYFINTGVGFDLSRNYKNVMVSFGVDIVRTLRTFEIIPKDPVPAFSGFFPDPHLVSADGLPEGITEGEKKKVVPISLDDVSTIINDIPQKLKEKMSASGPDSPKKRMVRRKYKSLKNYNYAPTQDDPEGLKKKNLPGSNSGSLDLSH